MAFYAVDCKQLMVFKLLLAVKFFRMIVTRTWAKPEVGGGFCLPAAVPDANFARLISISLSSSSSESFSGAKAKTPDAKLGRVEDGSPDKIPRSNLTCT